MGRRKWRPFSFSKTPRIHTDLIRLFEKPKHSHAICGSYVDFAVDDCRSDELVAIAEVVAAMIGVFTAV